MKGSLLPTASMALVLRAAWPVQAATTVRLPPWVCAHPDALFVDGFSGGAAVVRDGSGGSGGAAGTQSRTVSVPGWGNHAYVLYVPTRQASLRPMPVLLALHGAAGSPGDAQLAAQWLRDAWAPLAEAHGFVVVAPAATGALGGWIVPPPYPSDYDIMEAALADVENAYDIDRSRRIGWGFSAGAHVMYDLAFNAYSPQINIGTLAAVAIAAGTMEALACYPHQCPGILAAASRRIPVSIHIGNSDPLHPYALNDRDRLQQHGWVQGQTLFFTQFTGGHEFYPGHLAQVWTDLCPFQVRP